MQIFKNFLVACSLAIAVNPLYVQAEDSDAQAAARAALQQKIRELQGGAAPAEATLETPSRIEQQLPPPTPAPKKAGAKPAAPPAFEPIAVPGTSPETTLVLPQGAAPDLIEQARQSTRARMAELQAHRSTAIPAGRETPAPASDTVTTTTTVTAAPVVSTKPAQPSKAELRAAREQEAAAKRAAANQAAAAKRAAKSAADAEAAAQAKTAMHSQAAITQSKTVVSQKSSAHEKAAVQADAKVREAAAKPAKPAARIVEAPVQFTPLDAPSTGLPASKEQDLRSLLEQYKADKISSEEYQEQRAKILAAP